MTEDVTVGERVAQQAMWTAKELRASQRWSLARDRLLDEQFETATREALARQAFEERAARLKTLGRRVIPTRLRPLAKAIVSRLDLIRALRLARRRFSNTVDRRADVW